ncbi:MULTISPECIES: hypothetical protein [Chryseobacterium]|uniref:Uncharacterized protein n=2 Tax=Chryseobacterium TaxID=59732 RepID=A0ABX9X8A0_9FLAO|nr:MULTISPECIES: hypothetical protein [Chryseobacterium]KYH06500.1 hypothetical protein A1704_09455 [Chryseobacterium cucumeris]ROH92293.1 hypothetical protein EGI15_08570 [Chryseobacterium cucumeris]WFB66523.1 hypothetical protein PZ898_17515 [Chryseobacterium sp. WX]
MNENQDLLNLTGKIHQLVDYGIINTEKLQEIQSFCNQEMDRLLAEEFIERESIDWSKYIIYEQTESDGEINAGLATEMTNAYQSIPNIKDIYRNKLQVSGEVAADLFGKNARNVKIFLGELDNGLIFLFEDLLLQKYYIISNKIIKEEISAYNFGRYKDAYENGALKRILDPYIQQYIPNTVNTVRFALSRAFFAKLENLKPKYPNIVISFHPAIHISGDIFDVELDDGTIIQASYEYRLTFIMILGYYQGSKFIPIPDIGAYDRNGLCPPGC